jgi:hypothetical protein
MFPLTGSDRPARRRGRRLPVFRWEGTPGGEAGMHVGRAGLECIYRPGTAASQVVPARSASCQALRADVY